MCFRYLVGTKDPDILFEPNINSGIVGYTESDFAGCVDSPESTTGYCFKFGNGAISWKSKLQECRATSTTEAEYVPHPTPRKRLYNSVGWHRRSHSVIRTLREKRMEYRLNKYKEIEENTKICITK